MLRIRLFGQLEIRTNGAAVCELHTKNCEALLAMLLLRRGQLIPREQIVGELWGDLPEEKARRCLSSDLWRLKDDLKSAEMGSSDYLQCRDRSIAFDDRPHWVDIHAFHNGLTPMRARSPTQFSPADLAQIETALALYRGDLVVDLHHDYFLVLREALRAKYLRALESVMQHHMFHARLDDAIDYGQKLLSLDPLLEHVQQELMLCHFRSGNRAAALRQYAVCEQILWDELRIGPMPETREIYRRLTADKQRLRPVPERTASRGPSDHLGSALRHLNAAQSDVLDAQSKLKRR